MNNAWMATSTFLACLEGCQDLQIIQKRRTLT